MTLLNCVLFVSADSVVINYGRGDSPILPLDIQCDNRSHVLSSCSSVDLDVSKCMSIAGVDCRGGINKLEEQVLTTNLQLPAVLQVKWKGVVFVLTKEIVALMMIS